MSGRLVEEKSRLASVFKTSMSDTSDLTDPYDTSDHPVNGAVAEGGRSLRTVLPGVMRSEFDNGLPGRLRPTRLQKGLHELAPIT